MVSRIILGDFLKNRPEELVFAWTLKIILGRFTMLRRRNRLHHLSLKTNFRLKRYASLHFDEGEILGVGSEIILIGDERVKNISVQECGEPIVDLLSEFPQLTFDLDRLHVQKQSKSISHARREVGLRLLQAQKLLPDGLKLIIKECYRPMWVQKGFWDGYSSFLRKKFPDWSEEQVYEECSKLNAPLDVAPHTTGGAIDLTLTEKDGRWLDMGTEFNAEPLKTENATYTGAENINQSAKQNRAILVKAMTEAGFNNYPTEWWHWSYGDKYWALQKDEPLAIYGSQDLERN